MREVKNRTQDGWWRIGRRKPITSVQGGGLLEMPMSQQIPSAVIIPLHYHVMSLGEQRSGSRSATSPLILTHTSRSSLHLQFVPLTTFMTWKRCSAGHGGYLGIVIWNCLKTVLLPLKETFRAGHGGYLGLIPWYEIFQRFSRYHCWKCCENVILYLPLLRIWLCW